MSDTEQRTSAIDDAHTALRRFLSADCSERLFCWPTQHPARGTGFCHCDTSFLATLRVCLRGILMETLLRLPFNNPKLWLLRKLGACIGEHVYISAGAWIDPLYPHLLTIEDDVFIGMGARIFTHEFRPHEFRAGRVILRQRAFIGAYSLLECGIEIGEEATVAPAAVIGKDVPAGHTALGNPARVLGTSKEAPHD